MSEKIKLRCRMSECQKSDSLAAKCDTCNGTGKVKAYRGEPSQGTEWVACDECNGRDAV